MSTANHTDTATAQRRELIDSVERRLGEATRAFAIAGAIAGALAGYWLGRTMALEEFKQREPAADYPAVQWRETLPELRAEPTPEPMRVTF